MGMNKNNSIIAKYEIEKKPKFNDFPSKIIPFFFLVLLNQFSSFLRQTHCSIFQALGCINSSTKFFATFMQSLKKNLRIKIQKCQKCQNAILPEVQD